MAQYRNAVMTQNGAALLNKAQAGLCKIKFTRISTGDGEYSESEKGIEELRKITSLKSHKQSFMFDSIKYLNDTSVELKASITNHDDTQTLSVGYYIREIAVFAQEDGENDTEVLYSIAVANVADFLPPYNGNNPTLIIQKYYATVDESRSAITVPSHYGEDLDVVKEDLEKEWKEYAKNIDEEMKKRPEKDGKADEMTVTFTEAANRENIVTGEKASTLMGKIKKWLADLAAAAFMQVVTSYSDLMAGTALDNYLIGAAAAKEGFTELNGKLKSVDYDITFPSGVTTDFVHCKRTGNIVDFGFRILSGSIPYGSPLATLPADLHTKYNILIPSQYLVINDVASTGNVRLMYNGSIFQEYSATGTLNACVIKGTFII